MQPQDDDSLAARKAALRRVAAAARQAAHAALGPGAADAALQHALGLRDTRGRVLAGYIPMRSEISPLSALASHDGPVCLPMVEAPQAPLRFRAWSPGAALVPGGFGTSIPATGDWLVPEVLIVPLLAFDRRGYRLGYGGGFYDRTLAGLRAGQAGRGGRGCIAIGLGFGAQEVSHLPTGPHDAPLDMIVTEGGIIRPSAGGD